MVAEGLESRYTAYWDDATFTESEHKPWPLAVGCGATASRCHHGNSGQPRRAAGGGRGVDATRSR